MAMLAGTAADEHHEQFAGIEVLAKQIATARGQERHSIFTQFSIQKDRGLSLAPTLLHGRLYRFSGICSHVELRGAVCPLVAKAR